MTLRDRADAVAETGARIVERIQTVQIAPGGLGLMQLFKLLLILALVLSLAYVQGCRNGQADLLAQMEASNRAKPILAEEGNRIRVSDLAEKRRLEAENAKLKAEIEASRRRRVEAILNPQCGGCVIDSARFPIGMRNGTDTNR